VNIVFFGPPGSGKGTQAEKIGKKFKFHKVSTGDLLRDSIKQKSPLTKEIKNTLEKGQFVSDEIVLKLIENVISKKENFNKLIFDGYPRNISQAYSLENLLKKYNQKISCVFSLNVDEDLLLKRLIGRLVCSKCGLTFNKSFNAPNKTHHLCDNKFLEKRSDDNETTIKNRFKTYKKETLPVLKFYKEQKLLREIDGMGEINEIYSEIGSIITSLETWLCKLYLYK